MDVAEILKSLTGAFPEAISEKKPLSPKSVPGHTWIGRR